MKSIQTKRRMKILVVEANDQARLTVTSALSTASTASTSATSELRIDYEVFEAKGIEDAKTSFAALHPDLVLISTSEGLEGGRSLCQSIRSREDERHTGIIFIAGSSEHHEMLPVECLELGADDFFASGITPREMTARINAVLRLKAMTDELRSANHRLEILSLTDELTGLHNMRSFNLQYSDILRRCREGESGLGVIMVDLDRFKSVNDRTNHLVGSHVISEVGKLMRLSGILGQNSCPARYGGDEYVICLLTDDVYDVMAKAEKLRELIFNSVFKKDGYTLRLTSSIGVSWVDPLFDGKSDDPIKAADVMLYRSKKNGRNQVSGMILRYPVDFNHVGRPHLVDRDASGENYRVPRLNNF